MSFKISYFQYQFFRLPPTVQVKDITNYYFFIVSDEGEPLIVYDEERPLSAIQMFLPVLALKEPDDNEINKKFVKEISEFQRNFMNGMRFLKIL